MGKFALPLSLRRNMGNAIYRKDELENKIRVRNMRHKTSVSSEVRARGVYRKGLIPMGVNYGHWTWPTGYKSSQIYYLGNIGTKAYWIRWASPYKIIIYDAVTNTWDRLSGAQTTTRFTLSFSLNVAVQNGKIYYQQRSSPYRLIWYDATTNTWDETSGATRPTPTSVFSLMNGYGSYLYLYTSGSDDYLYDTDTNVWSAISKPVGVFVGGGLIYPPYIVSNKAYFPWGSFSHDSQNRMPIYDFNNNTWSYSSPFIIDGGSYYFDYGEYVPLGQYNGAIWFTKYTESKESTICSYDCATDTFDYNYDVPPVNIPYILNNANTKNADTNGLLWVYISGYAYYYNVTLNEWIIRPITTSGATYTFLNDMNGKKFIYANSLATINDYFSIDGIGEIRINI